MRALPSLFASLALSMLSLTPAALTPERAAWTLDARIESPHPIESGFWQQEVRMPEASFVKAHLGRLRLGPEDELLVSDGSGQTVYRVRGPVSAALWLPSAPGGTLRLEVFSAPGSTPWGLSVDRVAFGVGCASPGPWRSESCGADDSLDAVCYDADAARRVAGEAVGWMLMPYGTQYWVCCTGFLVSPQGHFLTNAHCIDDEMVAEGLEVGWKYQRPDCGSGDAAKESSSLGARLVTYDHALDYALLLLDAPNPAPQFGYLPLGSQVPAVGTPVWVPNHNLCGPKRFSVVSDMDGGPVTVRAVDLDNITGGLGTDIGYWSDTEPGSSGSPVLDDSETVVALNHLGPAPGFACSNDLMPQGVEMAKILPAIAPYLSGQDFIALALAARQGTSPTAFAFSAETREGVEPYTFDWDFGDGSPHSDQAGPVHTYASPGAYSVMLSVTDSAGRHATDGHLRVAAVAPPVIRSVVWKAKAPKLKVAGSNFAKGCKIRVEGWELETTLRQKKTLAFGLDQNLGDLIEPGHEVRVTVINPPPGTASPPFTFTR